MARKKTETEENSEQINVNSEKEATKTLDNISEDVNIGRKNLDPSSHSHIAEIDDVDEITQRKIDYENQERKSKLGVSSLDNEDEVLDTQIISQELVEQLSRSNKVERFNVDIEKGLSNDQVQQRISEGLVNDNQKQYSKTYKQIFVNNIFTFFNILCVFVAAALIFVKEYKNLTFLIILIINTVIGIYQEIKAKQTIDKLSIVTAPTATVTRESLTHDIPVKELVLDDIVSLKNGKQISADCKIVKGEIEVNEALLTGESDTVRKGVGSNLYAGSFVTAGSCMAKVERVGQDCYIQKLQAKAKKYSKPKSELLKSLQLITTFITIIIIPLGSIIAYRNYSSAKETVYSPTFSNSGTLMVYGIDEQGTANEISKLTDIKELSTKQISLNTNDNIIPYKQIKIEYVNKVSGNISISKINIYAASGDEESGYTKGDVLDSSVFDTKDSLSQLSSFNSTLYDDGSVKLDESGEYITTKSFAATQKLYIDVYVESRGYGYDSSDDISVIRQQIIKSTVTKTAGSIVGMIPAGLFLLVTISLSASVVKLSKSKTLVQELYCIEMLARVDCICLDKTGTITDGTMKVKDIIDLSSEDSLKGMSIDKIMGSFIGAFEDNNLTSIALKDKFGVNFDYKKVATVPFSSARKMSAVTFEDKGTFILGAPEYVYQGKSKKVMNIVEMKSSMGYRVLMLAKSERPIVNGNIPAPTSYLSLIVLEDHIREEAYDTIKWFNENGVQVKVISGDNPSTVAEIAGKAGIENASEYISLEGLSPQEVETIANDYTVFGRVSPDQKAILIKTLKQHGRTVAMTGDGVNDILAMKESDCSVAMASGSDAARNVAHLVLLDSNFANMPKVVLEGRRVINDIQASSSLYLMKTIFVMVITFLSIVGKNIFKTGYPFEPIQFMMLEMFVIGLPSTILALQPNNKQIHGSFIRNVFMNCIAQAFCLIAAVTSIYLIARKGIDGLDLTNYDELNTIAVIVLTYVGWVILINVCRPFNTLRLIVCLVSLFLITSCMVIPDLAELLGINYKFSELGITKQLLTISIVLAIVPIERFFNDLINKFNEKPKNLKEVQ